MEPFLGKAVFPDAVPNGEVAVSMVGQARFRGCIAFTNWPRHELEAVLPAELELATNTAAPDVHPMVFVFGEQCDGAIRFGGFTVPTGIRYYELGLAIPFVVHRHRRGLHIYVPRMYSSYFPAVWGGMYYGFSKELIRTRADGADVQITRENGVPLLGARVDPTGPWTVGATNRIANFDAMREVFSLPVLGRTASGRYVGSYFGWNFQDSAVRPANAVLTTQAPLLQGLPARRIAGVVDGVFEVEDLCWRLSWPTD